jgi:hypothetical protein
MVDITCIKCKYIVNIVNVDHYMHIFVALFFPELRELKQLSFIREIYINIKLSVIKKLLCDSYFVHITTQKLFSNRRFFLHMVNTLQRYSRYSTMYVGTVVWKISYLLCRPSCSKRFRSTQTVIKILSRNELCFTNFVFILGPSATFSDASLKRFGYDMV